MITEVRVKGTGQVIWDGTHLEVTKPSNITLKGNILAIEELSPEPELPDSLEPIKNYLHREWEIDRALPKIYADGWYVAEVFTYINTDGIGVKEMFEGNRSLIKNAPRAYEALIALYNEVMEDSDKEIDNDVLLEVAEVAKAIEQGE